MRKHVWTMFPKEHSYYSNERDLNLGMTPELLAPKMTVQSHWNKSKGEIRALLLKLVSRLRCWVDYKSESLGK